MAEFVIQPELAISHLENVKNKKTALEWLLCGEHKRFDSSFSLSKLQDLCQHLGFNQIERYLTLQELHSVKELYLEGCGLTDIPNVSSLSHLKVIDCRNNEIQDIKRSLIKCKFVNVEKICLTGNPFIMLDFDVSNVSPSLKTLTFGSNSTNFVRLMFLDTLVTMNVEIILEEGQDIIIFPPHQYLLGKEGNLEDLSDLCKTPEKILPFLESVDKKFNWLKWLLDDEQYTCISLNLSGEKELVNYHSNKILTNHKLSSIEKLFLNDCDLSECPNISLYPNLAHLDLGNNLLTDWCFQSRHGNLQQLILSGNPIPAIMDEFNCFPALRKLTVGSEKTEYIDIALLRRMLSGNKQYMENSENREIGPQKIVIKIDKDKNNGEIYRQHLKCPPFRVIKRNIVSDYIASPETVHSEIKDIEERIRALDWLVNNYNDMFKSFSLTGEKELCGRLAILGLEKIFSRIQSIVTLNISNCGLVTLPDIQCLPKLESLNISQNNINEFPRLFQHETLKKMYIEQTSIKVVDLDKFPCVTFLVCGSKCAWQIVPRTLRKVANDLLKIEVIPEGQSNLTFPPYDVLKHGSAAVASHIDNEELDLTRVRGDNLSTYMSLVENAKKPIKLIRLSKVQNLTNLLEKSEFRTLLHMEKLRKNVEILYIDSCQIEEYPEEIALPNLKQIDMSNNILRDNFERIPSSITILKLQNCRISVLPKRTHLEVTDARDNNIKNLDIGFNYPRLKELLVDGNGISNIALNTKMFPALETLSCGSSLTHFISRPVLELHRNKGLLHIPQMYLNFLYLPPGHLLNSSNLKNYIDSPEKYLDEVDESHKQESLTWLLGDIKENIKIFTLSGQENLCQILKFRGLQNLLNNKKLSQLENLHLGTCGLTAAPKIDHLAKLKFLNLSNNHIKGLRWDFKHPALEILYFQGNPTDKLDFNSKDFPALKHIIFGSKETKELSPSFLERIAESKLDYFVPEQYRSTLTNPPYGTLDGERTGLKSYLQGELDLSSSKFRKKANHTINTLINKHPVDIKILKLSGQSVWVQQEQSLKRLLELRKLEKVTELYLDGCNINEIPDVTHLKHLLRLDISHNPVNKDCLSIKLNIRQLQQLNLNNCNLDLLPSLAHLPCLKKLDISQNKFKTTIDDKYFMRIFNTKFEKPHPLEVLNLSGNHIEEIHVNTTSFSSLHNIICGSERTHFISFHLMTEASKGNVIISVPEKYKQHLLVPSSTMLDDPRSSFFDFLQKKNVDLKRIPDVQKRKKACEWLFRCNEYTELRLSGQGDFCKDKTINIVNFLSHPNLSNIEKVYLDNCDLDKIPLTKKSLSNLKELDVSGNNLSEIFTTFSSHKKT